MGIGIALTFACGIIRLITAIPGISDQLGKKEQYWMCFVSQILNGKCIRNICVFQSVFCFYHPLKLRYLHKYIYFTGLGNPSAICIATKVRTLRYVSFNVHSNFVNLPNVCMYRIAFKDVFVY